MRRSVEPAWLAAIFGGAVLFGILISPVITWGLMSLPESIALFGREIRIPEYIGRKGYAAVLSRVIMVSAVAGFILFHRRLGLREPRRLGLPWPGAFHVRDLAAGACIAIAACLVIFLIKFAVGEFVWDTDKRSVGRILYAVPASWIVGFAEEIIIHGILFGGLLRAVGLWPAVLVTNYVYSAAHCLNAMNADLREAIRISGPLDFAAGPVAIWQAIVSAWADPAVILLKFGTLYLFGLLLTWAVLRRRSLYLAIGLHAGVVFFLLADGAVRGMSETFDHERWAWLLGGKQMEASFAGWVAMVLMFVMLRGWLGRTRPPEADLTDETFLPAGRPAVAEAPVADTEVAGHEPREATAGARA